MTFGPSECRARGGVDNLALTSGGTSYRVQPIVQFSQPDLATGTVATATAVMDVNGVVTSLNVVTPGSGYTTAPTVDVFDGAIANPTGAKVVATIGIGQIDVTSGGTGYTSAPTVTITDSVIPLAIGTHTVSATYGGSVNFLPSTSANFTQLVQ